MARMSAGLAASIFLCSCLYVEAGGGVYGGSVSGDGRPAAGWSVLGGAYVELDDKIRFGGGGGGTFIESRGESYIGAGPHLHLDGTLATRECRDRLRHLLRLTFGLGGSPHDSEDPDRHLGSAGFLGVTLTRSRRGVPVVAFDQYQLYVSAGLEVVHAGPGTFVGPSLRVGAGANFATLVGIYGN